MTTGSPLRYFTVILLLSKWTDADDSRVPLKVTSECKDTSILFSMEHSKKDVQWEIGSLPLTQRLATERGYIMHNTNQHMILEVPLFSVGYRYEDINLRHFYGSFGVTFRDTKTTNISETTVQRCLFKTHELIVCDPKGIVTVVASTTVVSPQMNPNKTSLLDSRCRPVETDNSRVLFVFTVDTCGTKSGIGGNYVIYENEIVLLRDILSARRGFITRDSDFRLTIRCNYRATAISTFSVQSVPRSSILTPGRGSVVEMRQDKTRKWSRFRPGDGGILNIVRAEAEVPQAQQLTKDGTSEPPDEERATHDVLVYVSVLLVVISVLGISFAAMRKMCFLK